MIIVFPVTDPPRFVVKPQSVTVELGDIAMLNCRADGQPKPDVTWQRDEREIVGVYRMSTLHNNSLRCTLEKTLTNPRPFSKLNAC